MKQAHILQTSSQLRKLRDALSKFPLTVQQREKKYEFEHFDADRNPVNLQYMVLDITTKMLKIDTDVVDSLPKEFKLKIRSELSKLGIKI